MDKSDPAGKGSFSMNRKANTTIGPYSHAEGYNNTASGWNSHAEGEYNVASESNAHAEGLQTTASGMASHAEGSGTTASGAYSHAEGEGTVAGGKGSHAGGMYNISDTSTIDRKTGRRKYTHIIGNGTSDTARSNAHTLDWEGNAWYSGDVYVGSTSGTNRDKGSKKLATVEEVQELAVEKAAEAARIMKEDILNGADAAYDTLKEVGALIEENREAIEALEIIAGKQADWNQSDANAKDFIKNKPTNLTTKEDLNKAIEEIDLSGYATETFVEEKIAEAELNKEEIDLSGYALKTELPTKISQLKNDSNYLTAVPEGYVKSLSDLGITATATELNYVDGVKSGIQSQLNNKMQSNNPIYSGTVAHHLSANLELGQDSVTFSVGGIASGSNAFAEGASTQAYGAASHSEGNNTIARGQASHAEGYRTKVKADSRGGHAEGIFTIATAPGQHAQGSANVEDEDQIYAHIVGNGSDEENRSNAYALDWQGNGWFAGDVYVGSISGIDKDEGSKKLATEDLVAQKTQVQIITWGADD